MIDAEDAAFAIIVMGIVLLLLGGMATLFHHIPPFVQWAIGVITSFPEWAASATLADWGAAMVWWGMATFFVGIFLFLAFAGDLEEDEGSAEPPGGPA